MYILRAGTAAAFAAAASSEGKDVVPGRRVRLRLKTSPSSCQEPLHPSAREARDGRGRGDRGNKGIARVQSAFTVSAVPSPDFGGLPAPRDRDPPHPSLRGRTKRESRPGKGQIMFLVSDTEPEGG